jgi:hypothetical protein
MRIEELLQQPWLTINPPIWAPGMENWLHLHEAASATLQYRSETEPIPPKPVEDYEHEKTKDSAGDDKISPSVVRIDFNEFMIKHAEPTAIFSSLKNLLAFTHDILGSFPASGRLRLLAANGCEIGIYINRRKDGVHVVIEVIKYPAIPHTEVWFQIGNPFGWLASEGAKMSNSVHEAEFRENFARDFQLIEAAVLKVASTTNLPGSKHCKTERPPAKAKSVLDNKWIIVWGLDASEIFTLLAKAMRFYGMYRIQVDESTLQVVGTDRPTNINYQERVIATLFSTVDNNVVIGLARIEAPSKNLENMLKNIFPGTPNVLEYLAHRIINEINHLTAN